MKFDRNALKEAVETDITLENGKALLTWRFRYSGEIRKALLTLLLKDQSGQTVLTCLRREPEEEPLQAVLLRPRLWNGPDDPYLYKMEILLQEQDGQLLDRIDAPLPLRCIKRLPEQGFFLNDNPFSPKTIDYTLPKAESPIQLQRAIMDDIQYLLELGINSIHCSDADADFRLLSQLCDRAGILLLPEAGDFSLRDGGHGLLDPATGNPNTLFYKCKAKWSTQPFVYISPESIQTTESGNYKVTVYSSCGRIALYTDGVLFAFQSGEYEFVFEGIPARHPCVMLTAEADGCSVSFAVHKSAFL